MSIFVVRHGLRYGFVRRVLVVAALALGPLVLAACGSGPPPRLFLLDEQILAPVESRADASSITWLGISQVTVPGYASDPRIATLLDDGAVAQLGGYRWAEEPEEAITRFLAERLRQHAQAIVLVEPWPRDYEPQARVEVTFDRLLRDTNGGATLAGQIQLLSADGRKLLLSVPFDQKILGRSTDSAEFFNSVSVGVDAIARLAVQALLNLRANA